jgi:hypothetical protein
MKFYLKNNFIFLKYMTIMKLVKKPRFAINLMVNKIPVYQKNSEDSDTDEINIIRRKQILYTLIKWMSPTEFEQLLNQSSEHEQKELKEIKQLREWYMYDQYRV